MGIILIDSNGNKWKSELMSENKPQYIILDQTIEYFELQEDGTYKQIESIPNVELVCECDPYDLQLIDGEQF